MKDSKRVTTRLPDYWPQIVACSLLVAGLFLVPILVQGFLLQFLTSVFLWVAIASAWNLMAGGGYISLATGAWYGLGAYSTAVLMNEFNASFFLAAVISCSWITAFSILVSIPLLRLRSHYFIMGSFIVAEVIRLLMKQVRIFGLEGGAPVQLPVAFPGEPEPFNRFFYYVGLVFAVSVLVLFATLSRKRIGFALRAIGQDEAIAEMSGIPTTRYKLTAFGLSSAVIALAGSISGYWIGYLEIDTFFSLLVSIKAIVTVVLGGLGTILGPVFGVTIIQYIEQILGPELAQLSQVIYGAIILVVIVLLPRGLVSALRIAFARVIHLAKRDPDSPANKGSQGITSSTE